MIGEGIQSTNQRKHSYVQDRVEVGFFTDPSVCIGCKACEVACKEWIKKYVPEGGPPNLHPEQPPPGASAGAEAGGHGQHGKTDSR